MRATLIASCILLASADVGLAGDLHDSPPRDFVCPYPGSEVADGCSTAHINAAVQHSNFFVNYANQSGQTYTTRPAWNVAGVDWPVGYYTPLSSMADAASLSGQQGCTLFKSEGTEELSCTGSGTLNITGYNFGTGATFPSGIWLYIHGRYSSCTISDSYFLNGTTTDRNNGSLVRIDDGCPTLVLQDNSFDGNYDVITSGNLAYLVEDNATDRVLGTLQRNAFLRSPQKSLSIGVGPRAVVANQFNYYEGLGVQTAAHGEFDFLGSGTLNYTRRYNTALQPAKAPATGTGGVTALFYTSHGKLTDGIYTLTDNHNVEVANLKGGRGGSAFVSAMGQLGALRFLSVSHTNDYFDVTGSLLRRGMTIAGSCTIPGAFSRNLNLVTGTSMNSWSVNTGRGC